MPKTGRARKVEEGRQGVGYLGGRSAQARARGGGRCMQVRKGTLIAFGAVNVGAQFCFESSIRLYASTSSEIAWVFDVLSSFVFRVLPPLEVACIFKRSEPHDTESCKAPNGGSESTGRLRVPCCNQGTCRGMARRACHPNA